MTPFQEKVLKKLGVRPKSAQRIAEQLGYDSFRGVARALGELWYLGAAESVAGRGWVRGARA